MRPDFPGNYILVDGEPVLEPGLETWARWFESADRRVSETILAGDGGPDVIRVSTVFLGLDHSHGGPPLLYETMIFGGPDDGEMWRCSTRAQAVAQHGLVVACLKSGGLFVGE